MTPCRAGAVLHQIHRLIDTHDPENLSDRELLECFIRQRDEEAFTALLRRHGPMVMRVCRRVLHDWHAAEDAFQATFLVLARKASSIRRREGVGGWLHGVAYRLALKALRRTRKALPEPAAIAASPDPLDQLTLREAQMVLDEELHKLPAKYREPLLLCYLEAKTRDEAARQLNWPLGTLKSRVERGRELLRVGLERRGLTLSAVLTAAVLTPRTAPAALSAEALRQTAQAALRFATGPGQVAAGLSPEAVALAKGAFPMLSFTSLRWIAVALVALALVGPGLGLVLYQTPGTPPDAPAQSEPPPHTARPPAQDVHGDPLPPDSVARLGTMRWRQEDEVAFLDYLPDGRHLLTRGLNGRFHLWDRRTGQVVREFGNSQQPEKGRKDTPAKSGSMMMKGTGGGGQTGLWPGAAALAPDGQTVAAAELNGAVALWEVATGKERRHWKAGGSAGLLNLVADLGTNQVTVLVFSPDGKRLAARSGDGTLRVWDLTDGHEIRKFGGSGLLGGLNTALSVGFKKALAFSPDGKILTVVEPGIGLMTAQGGLALTIDRWEVATGKKLSPPAKFTDVPLFGSVSPDGKLLAIATAQKAVVLWDLTTNREVRRINLGGTLLEFASQLTFSPDGKLLAIKAGSQPIGIWDVAEGKELCRLGESREEGTVAGMIRSGVALTLGRLVFAPDGRRLAETEGGRAIRQWDVASGKETDHFAGHGGPVKTVALAPDGRSVYTEAEDTVIQWDATGGKVLQQFRVPNVTHAVASADGRALLLGSTDGMLTVRDVRMGKEAHRWKAHAATDFAGGVFSIPPLLSIALAPDGKQAASWGSDQTIRLWDVTTGRKLQELPAKVPGVEGLPSEFIGLVVAAVNTVEPSHRLVFSTDGAQLAVLPIRFVGVAEMAQVMQAQLGNRPTKRATKPEPPAIGLWDLATGQLVRRFDPAPDNLLTGAFAPDGRTLATGQADGSVVLWETATGKPRLRLRTGTDSAVRALCFTADSRLLIGGVDDGAIRIWDLLRGEEVRRLQGHRGGIMSLALSADGKTLVSGSRDTTALIWPMPARVHQQSSRAVPPKAEQLDEPWRDLAGTDALKAYQAIRALSAAPEPAVAWLRERLRPVPGPDAATLQQWIAGLDSDRFEVRKQAEEELEKLGPLAHPALRRALADGPSLQVQQRLERLLKKQVTGQALSGEELRGLRAIEVLEQIGTPEARQVLKKLAQGAEGAALTREAQAACRRLAR
jgi:RNA polymerase sigma factor (sigma-70 family)